VLSLMHGVDPEIVARMGVFKECRLSLNESLEATDPSRGGSICLCMTSGSAIGAMSGGLSDEWEVPVLPVVPRCDQMGESGRAQV
jgi:hypothetical protein